MAKVKAKAKTNLSRLHVVDDPNPNDDLKARYRDYCGRVRAEGGNPKSFGLWKEGMAEPEDVHPVHDEEATAPETLRPVEPEDLPTFDTHRKSMRQSFLLRLALDQLSFVVEDFVLRRCKSGYYVMVLLWDSTGSEAVEKKSSWQTVTGIVDDPYTAMALAFSSPVVAQVASLKGEPLPLLPGNVIGKSAEPTVDELIDMLHDRIAPDSDSEEFRIAVNSMQTDGSKLSKVTRVEPDEFKKTADHTGRETERKVSEEELIQQQRHERYHELREQQREAGDRRDYDECKRIEQVLVDEGFVEPKANPTTPTQTNEAKSTPSGSKTTTAGSSVKSAKVERGDKKPELKREETEEAINERLNQLVGKRVRAKRKFHSGGNKASDVVEGTYIGNAYPTASGTFHGVKKDNGTTTAVLPETIIFLEDAEAHPDTAKA